MSPPLSSVSVSKGVIRHLLHARVGTGVRSHRGHDGSEGLSVLFSSPFPLLSPSRSFFHPKKEGKAKKPEEASNSIRETEPPPKYVMGLGCDEFVPLSVTTLLATSVTNSAQNVSELRREFLTSVTGKYKGMPASGTAVSRASEMSPGLCSRHLSFILEQTFSKRQRSWPLAAFQCQLI